MTKKLLILAFTLAALLVGTSSSAFAVAVSCADSSILTYQDLINVSAPNAGALTTETGCIIGDKHFDLFGFGSSDITANGIQIVSVIDNQPIATGFTFQFNLSALNGSPFSQDFTIQYLIYTVGNGTTGPLAGPALITSAHLDQVAVAVQNAAASIVEHVCLNSLSPCGGGPTLNTLQDGGTNNISNADVNFAASSAIFINKDVNVTAGDPGFANMSNLTETVDQLGTPEPATMSFLGAGLIALGLIGRKKFVR